jgi:hypothetical protein
MIQKEQFKELQNELHENLEVLHIPRYVWFWPELLYNTLKLLPMFGQFRHLQYQIKRALEITKEIYG